MKLYTEEQIKNAYTQIWADGGHDKYSLSGLEEMLEQLTPIELPSDEEIEEYADSVMPYAEKIGGETYTAYRAIKLGAKYVIYKIGGNK